MVKEIKIKDSPNGPVAVIEKEFLLTDPISIFHCNEYLRSLKTSQEVKFENYKQYQDLLKKIAGELGIPFSIEREV